MNDDLQLLRKGLWPLSLLYGAAVAARNLTFDLGLRPCHRVGAPVVSVGNLAAGGTGKTPLVVWLVERARAAGLRPGVVARGYGKRPGEPLNDEGLLLQRRFPDLPQVQHPDRVHAARQLLDGRDVGLVILDDGFQHRRLHRDRDLVCLDTARPFAGGLLPAGDLREWPRGLRRADAMVLTRAGGFTADARARRVEELRRFGSPGVRMFVADHVPVRLREMPAGVVREVGELRGARVHLLSAIARPETFAETVAGLGAEVVGHTARRDHHAHGPEELLRVAAAAEAAKALLVTTEKDDVKLGSSPVPRTVVELDLEFLGEAPEAGWLAGGGASGGDAEP